MNEQQGNTEEEIWKKPQAARFIASSTRSLDSYMRQGLPYTKLPSGKVLFRKSQIIAWLAKYQHGSVF